MANMKKLFIPGPVQVDRRVLEEMARPMMHHRSAECVALIREINGLLSELLGTKDSIFLLTSSATGAMEACIRSCVISRVLCIANGEFGRRWHSVAVSNGKDARLLDFGDGALVDYGAVADELRKGDFDAVTFIINETSTGMENDSKALKAAVQAASGDAAKDIIILADGVSAVFGTKVDMADYDALLFATQKSLALPPGMSIIIANSRAIGRAKLVKGRGYYFDFLLLKKRSDENMTTTTPALPILYALRYRLQEIGKQGIGSYINRHKAMAELVRSRIRGMGFRLFVPSSYSNTVTVISNNLGVDTEGLIRLLSEKGYVIENGYGPLKNKTFRISHMGDITPADTGELLAEMEKIVKSQLSASSLP
ncbi:alanine--glyoxylate aminotransferase family protein [Candidatus Woesearchaeota archaeon]|nr:alanine--glyoxylate aminotransferase family protein [Candidatus Woesearchaeota archaeon]